MNEAPQYCDAAAQLRHAQVNALDGERFGVVSSDGRRYWLKPAFGYPGLDQSARSRAGDNG